MNIDKTGGKMDDLNQSPDPEQNGDLLQIKGIGKSTAQILNSVGIHDCVDLASYTLEELIELVKGKLPSITLQRIERDDWIGQARLLIQSQSEEVLSPPETEPAAVPAEPVRSTPPEKDTSENWQELADFFVSFGNAIKESGKTQLKTKIYYSQSDISEEWEGIATDQLLDWMLTQSNLLSHAQVLQEETSSDLPTPQEFSEEFVEESSAPEVKVELSEILVSEITAVPATKQPQSAQLRSKSSLNLKGSDASLVAEQKVPYFIETYLVNLNTNQSNLVGSYSGELEPGYFTYEIQQDFPVPPLGEYQIYLFARLVHPTLAPVHIQGPIIDVQP